MLKIEKYSYSCVWEHYYSHRSINNIAKIIKDILHIDASMTIKEAFNYTFEDNNNRDNNIIFYLLEYLGAIDDSNEDNILLQEMSLISLSLKERFVDIISFFIDNRTFSIAESDGDLYQISSYCENEDLPIGEKQIWEN